MRVFKFVSYDFPFVSFSYQLVPGWMIFDGQQVQRLSIRYHVGWAGVWAFLGDCSYEPSPRVRRWQN